MTPSEAKRRRERIEIDPDLTLTLIALVLTTLYYISNEQYISPNVFSVYRKHQFVSLCYFNDHPEFEMRFFRRPLHTVFSLLTLSTIRSRTSIWVIFIFNRQGYSFCALVLVSLVSPSTISKSATYKAYIVRIFMYCTDHKTIESELFC